MNNIQFSNIESKLSRLITKIDCYERKHGSEYFFRHRFSPQGVGYKINRRIIYQYLNFAATQMKRHDWNDVMMIANLMWKEVR